MPRYGVWGGGLEGGGRGGRGHGGGEARPGTQATKYIPPPRPESPDPAAAPCSRAAPAAVKGRVSLRAHMVGVLLACGCTWEVEGGGSCGLSEGREQRDVKINCLTEHEICICTDIEET